MSRLVAPVSMAGVAAVGYTTLQALGRVAGSTPAERAARLPGDDLVTDAQLVTDHAVTIAVPPDRVWPWLTQLGWHMGGYYTPTWVDRVLFPANRPSVDRLVPALQRDLAPGDVIPDGPPGTAEYVVAEVDAPRLLVLRSTTHVPPGWGERYDARILWTWCLHLSPTYDGGTRLHLRVRGRMSPRWFAALYLATIPPADYVMATSMLRGIKQRAEATVAAAPAEQA